MNNILELNGVSKTFAKFALKDVSFALPEGFIMGFIGRNGAGKTTTIKLILNMLKKDSGIIRVFGKDHAQSEQEIKQRIGVVMDQPFYVEEWTPADLEKALLPFYAQWDPAKYSAQLEEFELDRQKKIKAFSRGMKLKLMIAAALSHQADLLILDEPTSGLDAVARNELMEILQTFISDENKGILFSTHVTSDLEKIADYITFIQDGRIVYSDIKDNLLEKYSLVKGPLGILSPAQKKLIIGYQERSVGFEGLLDRADLREMPASILAEPGNLDEIVLRFNLGKRTHE